MGVIILFSLTTQKALCQDYQLVWADEFTTSIGPDWAFETGNNNGWGNSELEYYRKENCTIENGNLVIAAKKESYSGFNYTSGRMNTQGKRAFKYGKIEARIKLPALTGLWSAFWMLGENISSVGWPQCGETDIMEQINTNMSIMGTGHWDNNGSHAQYGKSTSVTVTDYNIYSIEWTPSSIKWYVNGNLFNTLNITTLPAFNKPSFIILNLAIGGSLPGNTINNNALPGKMYVDYVRVYQKSDVCPAATLPATIQAEDYCNMKGIDVESTSDTDGGLNVGWFDAGDSMTYNVNIPTTGTYIVKYRVASPNSGKQLILADNGDSTQYGTINIPNTTGWQTWQTISQEIQFSAGIHTIAITSTTGGFNLNWMNISLKPASVEDIINNNVFTIYPNPVSDILTVNSTEELNSISIYNINGQCVYQLSNLANNLTLNLKNLPSGLYSIIATKHKNNIQLKKFIKQ